MSMVATVGGAREQAGVPVARAGAFFAAGLALGALVVFGGIGLLGEAVHPGSRVLLAVALASIVAVAGDAAGVRVRPQIRAQVPERWRRSLPLPLVLLLYGATLGTGLATYVPAAAGWALLALGLSLGNPIEALVIAGSLTLGRALPVLVLAPIERRGAGARALDLLANRPAGLRGVRLAGAAALAVAVASIVTTQATASPIVAGPATDPSAAGVDLAWSEPGVGGFLRSGGETIQLPGDDPAIGGSLVAWHVEGTVTVARRDGLTPIVQEPITGIRQLAISDTWLLLRTVGPDGASRLLAQSLDDTSRVLVLGAASPPAQVGRPSLSGDIAVFGTATPHGSWITSVNLRTGERRRLRSSRHDQLLSPSLEGGELLYARISRCAQQLRLGPAGSGSDRTLLTLPPLAAQDLGRERGHTDQGARTPCPGKPRPTATMLWTTALAATTAYVTTLRQGRSGPMPTILAVPR
jgi:hypothetical protein